MADPEAAASSAAVGAGTAASEVSFRAGAGYVLAPAAEVKADSGQGRRRYPRPGAPLALPDRSPPGSRPTLKPWARFAALLSRYLVVIAAPGARTMSVRRRS